MAHSRLGDTSPLFKMQQKYERVCRLVPQLNTFYHRIVPQHKEHDAICCAPATVEPTPGTVLPSASKQFRSARDDTSTCWSVFRKQRLVEASSTSTYGAANRVQLLHRAFLPLVVMEINPFYSLHNNE